MATENPTPRWRPVADRPPLEKLRAARDILRAWADREIICDTCVPAENRQPGCLSCDTLAFFEALDEALMEGEE